MRSLPFWNSKTVRQIPVCWDGPFVRFEPPLDFDPPRTRLNTPKGQVNPPSPVNSIKTRYLFQKESAIPSGVAGSFKEKPPLRRAGVKEECLRMAQHRKTVRTKIVLLLCLENISHRWFYPQAPRGDIFSAFGPFSAKFGDCVKNCRFNLLNNLSPPGA